MRGVWQDIPCVDKPKTAHAEARYSLPVWPVWSELLVQVGPQAAPAEDLSCAAPLANHAQPSIIRSALFTTCIPV